MGRNTYTWFRRSKDLFPNSAMAWQDIEKATGLSRKSVRVAHTKYYWRWKLNRLKKSFK